MRMDRQALAIRNLIVGVLLHHIAALAGMEYWHCVESTGEDHVASSPLRLVEEAFESL